MDVKELRPEVALEQLEQGCQALARAAQRGDERARARLASAQAGADELTAARAAVADEYGFESYGALTSHLRELREPNSATARFEAAVDALVGGDEAALRSALAASPALVTAHSNRKHRATLLHYVAANEVEDYRQRTPANILVLTKLLLEQGAKADAQAAGGGTALEWVVTSAHPAQAGVQTELIKLLVAGGAAVNGVRDDGAPLLFALTFGYADAADTLVAAGARIDDVVTMAALGRLESLRACFAADGKVALAAAPRSVPGLKIPLDAQARAEHALIFASTFGRREVVDFLLRQGVSPRAQDAQGFTALHWAAWKGHLDVVDLLLANGAPLEIRNAYGGTVLDATVWASGHSGEAVDYVPIVRRLLDAGADAAAVTPFPSGRAAIDALLAPHRAS